MAWHANASFIASFYAPFGQFISLTEFERVRKISIIVITDAHDTCAYASFNYSPTYEAE